MDDREKRFEPKIVTRVNVKNGDWNNATVTDLREQRTDTHCQYCKIPMREPVKDIVCNVCRAMVEAVSAHKWFRDAQAEWTEENQRRANVKRSLMGS